MKGLAMMNQESIRGTSRPGRACHRVKGWDPDTLQEVPLTEIEDPVKRLEVSGVDNCPFNRISRFQKGEIGARCLLYGGGLPNSGMPSCEGLRSRMCPLNSGVALVTVTQED